MGTNVRPLTVASGFLVALAAVATLGFMATPNNGKVEYLAITDTLNNKIGVKIIITDPDKIAQWTVFKGLERPGMHNQETWSPEDCSETTVTINLNARAHLTHDHVVTYVDCEENPHSEMWGIQPDTTGYPTDTTTAERVSFGDDDDSDDEEDSQHGMLLERNLFWNQVTAALVALTLLLTLVVVFRSRRG